MQTLRRQQSALDLAAAAAGSLHPTNEIPAPTNIDPESGLETPSVILSSGSEEAHAVTSDMNGHLYVWAGQKVQGAWEWTTENRPRVTMGVKTLASVIIAAGFAKQAYDKGDSSTAAKWTQAAGNILMNGAQTSEFAHYLHSAIKNFRTDPWDSGYDFLKSAAAGAAVGVGITGNIIPILREQAQTTWGLTNTIVQGAMGFVTGPSATEKIAQRRKENLGESHRNDHIPETRAPSNPYSSYASGQTVIQMQDLDRSGLTSRHTGARSTTTEPTPWQKVVDAGMANAVSDNLAYINRYGIHNPMASENAQGWTTFYLTAERARQESSTRPPTVAGPSNTRRSPSPGR